jgi:hypothetical protein
MRKAITATALEALPAVLLDNVDRVLGGASLDAALTALTWSDRVLGSNRTTGDLPLPTVWSATGNNLRFGSDLARRVLPIRLAPSCENPEERTDFAHANLLAWVRENRPRLAVAALTILRAYFVAGRPPQPGGTWGSFDEWSALVRGAICWAGLADPLATRETAKSDDTSGTIVRGLIGGLLEVDENGDGLTLREIINELNAAWNEQRFPTMRAVIAEVATSRGAIDQKKLGYAFRKYRGRIANGWELSGDSIHGGVIRWKAKRRGFGGDGGDAKTDPNHHPNHTKHRNLPSENVVGGDGGDTFLPPALRENLCVSHNRDNTHATHMVPHWDRPELSPESQPSQPDPGPPCHECGTITQLAAEVGGWRNADCPKCGAVKPIRCEVAR